MSKRRRVLFFLLLIFISTAFSQKEFVKIESNKVLSVFSFLETIIEQQGTSTSFNKYIKEKLNDKTQFRELVKSYKKLNLYYNIERQEYPTDRSSSGTNTKNLLWIIASNSKTINDFNERIIGILPHNTQVELIKLLKRGTAFYDTLIWDKEEKHTLKVEKELTVYKDKIKDLYLKISKFYNTIWDFNIPFKVVIYPIPLKKGNTTAIAKGNTLICSFLSHRKNEYKGILGIIIHEMCHVLYKEQKASFQHKINMWFNTSKSPYASLAYSYFNEGLATALGNGWAYKQIHNQIDKGDWYNDIYINGYAHALYPLITSYLEENKSIDKFFVEKAIMLFAEKFPKAIKETPILMNKVQLFSNTENEKEIDKIMNAMHKNFNIRSMWFSSPIVSEKSISSFSKKRTTKLFIIDSNHKKTIEKLNINYPKLNIENDVNTLSIRKDEGSQSMFLIINIKNYSQLEKGIKTLARLKHLENNKNYKIE